MINTTDITNHSEGQESLTRETSSGQHCERMERGSYPPQQPDSMIPAEQEEIPVIRNHIRIVVVMALFVLAGLLVVKAHRNLRYYLLPNSIHTNGVVELSRVHVSSTIPGILKTVLNEGDTVEKSDVAATLDDMALSSNVRVAEQKLAVIEEKNVLAIETTREKLQHDDQLAQRELIGPRRLDKAQREYDLAVVNARLERLAAQSELDAERSKLHETRLCAAQSGIVNEVLKQPGEPVKPNEPIIVIADPMDKWVQASIPLHKVQYLQLGQPVQIKPVLGLGTMYTGTIEQVYMLPRRDLEGREIVEAKISFNDPDGQLKPRTIVSLKIDTSKS